MAINDSIKQLNKVFDSRIRIGIMSALMVNDSLAFNDLKAIIDVTDGNLATHLRTLEEQAYITVQKGFIGRKTSTTYTITVKGQEAFRSHIDALEQIIKKLG
jgi:DNA-binding MarR family transcriptional regulator